MVQSQPLDQLEERAVVKVTRVRRNELVHAVLLRPVSICVPVFPSNQDTETQTDRQEMSKKRNPQHLEKHIAHTTGETGGTGGSMRFHQ